MDSMPVTCSVISRVESVCSRSRRALAISGCSVEIRVLVLFHRFDGVRWFGLARWGACCCNL